jgi:hypothetical protein
VTQAFNEPRYAFEPSDYRCSACESEVAVEAPFFSAIFFEAEVFRRRSYCPGCWSRPASALPEHFAFWRSRRPAPQAAPRRIRFDPDLVLEFFRRLAGADGEAETAGPEGGPPPAERVRLRLVLALLLLRRKYLVYQSAANREGREWLKLSEKADPQRVHLVENPPLSDAQIGEVKAALGDLLQMDMG